MKYKRLYIAYGSNINLEQMAHRCPTAKRVTTTAIPDYKLQFQRVATISTKKGKYISLDAPKEFEKIYVIPETEKKHWCECAIYKTNWK